MTVHAGLATARGLAADRSLHRLLAMLEASLRVAGGLALARLAHISGSMPAGCAVNVWTVVGGALLGLGAWVSKACVFGAGARGGPGEWAYAATPVGFCVGCLSVMSLFAWPVASKRSEESPLCQVSTLFAVMFVTFVTWRLRPGLLGLRRPDRVKRA